jgi:hypothetical protein
MDNNTSAENNKQLLKNIGTVVAIVFAIVFVIVSYLYLTGYNFNQIDENAKQYTEKATDVVVEKVAEVVSKVTENYEDFANIPVVLFNNITTSVSDVFSSISSMTFGGEPKKSGKMMALSLTGEKGKDGKDVVIPKFLCSDDNGNLSMFDLDKHTTDFGFLARSLTSTTSVTADTLNITGDKLKIASDGNITSKANISCNNITSSAKVTGGQLCIGNTCIDESQLKQLIRYDKDQPEITPLEYYAMGGTTLIFEHYQSVSPLGWSIVKTIVPGNKDGLRIIQQAYKAPWTGNASLDSDVSKMYTRYSLGSKVEIAGDPTKKIVGDATKNGWTAWKADVYLGNNSTTWRLSAEKDAHLRIYRNGVTRLDSDIAFTVHNVPEAGAWSYDKQLKKSGDYTGLQSYGGAIYTDAGCTASSCGNITL